MDDFNVSSLHESKNEWGARLLTILTPLIIEGYKSIFDEACKLCKENGEMDKYLMTFQNFITRIPKWNDNIIENERKRIVEKSKCTYLEELVTCIHIIQLKLLTAIRVGQRQKKIDINIPKLDTFIHKCYVNVARKLYKNVYLFEVGCSPLQVQRHMRELEIIVQECILNAVRDSIPVESILKAYMDETVEEDVIEEIKEQVIEESKPVAPSLTAAPQTVPPVASTTVESATPVSIETVSGSTLSFNHVDQILNEHGKEELVNAPKTLERLEEISVMRNMQRKLEEAEDEETITISNEDIALLDDIEVLD